MHIVSRLKNCVFSFKINFFFQKLVIVVYRTRLLKSKSRNQARLLGPNLVTERGYSIQNSEPNYVTRSKPRNRNRLLLEFRPMNESSYFSNKLRLSAINTNTNWYLFCLIPGFYYRLNRNNHQINFCGVSITSITSIFLYTDLLSSCLQIWYSILLQIIIFNCLYIT